MDDWFSLDDLKAHLGLSDGDTSEDDQLAAIVSTVVSDIKGFTSRRLPFGQEITEYHDEGGKALILKEFPVEEVLSFHASKDVPRIYDTTTLLVEGTEYEVDAENGIVELLATNRSLPAGPKAARLVYTISGPEDSLIWAACRIGSLYRKAPQTAGASSESLAGQTTVHYDYEKWPIDVLQILERLRRRP